MPSLIDRNDLLWYKNAVIYEAHVKAFFDANGDGIGDFVGFESKLDYLQELGVTAIWLLPFYPSPLRDDGYDIAAYRSVHDCYGTMPDFARLVRACHNRGIRVITELVINHTSDQHRWFQRARSAKKGSVFRDYYVWSDSDQRYKDARIIFVDAEKSNWTWDAEAQAYYWHRFYYHQPDLNFDNPHVLREVVNVMRFWLDIGVDGMRLDAIPYLVERDGTNCENLPDTHRVIRKIRAEIESKYPDRMLLAEANQWPEDVAPYFGEGNECHMCFHFPLMPRMYMAIAQEDRHPITDIMRQTPDIPANCQWAIFLRNHDELTLEMVTDRERDYLWSFYATDKRARLNLGIRRRLAPLLNNDRRQIELMASLLFSMPGTPLLYYGDEIGMGDNVYLGDRNGVRTPMQWSPDRNAGFSRADPAKLYLPPIMDPIYGYEAVNVEAQARNPSSLLNWMRRLIAMRQQRKALRVGTLQFLYPGNRKILAYLRECEGDSVLCVANLSHAAQAVELNLSAFKSRVPVELLGRSAFPPIGELPYLITLPAYGFYWFVLPQEAEMPAWHEEMPPPLPELLTVVMSNGWESVFSGREGRRLESDVLPAYIVKQRWFAAKDDRIAQARVAAVNALPMGNPPCMLVQVELKLAASGGTQCYLLPVAISWEEDAGSLTWPMLPYTLARVRRRSQMGALYEAAGSETFVFSLIDAIRRQQEVRSDGGMLLFEAMPHLAQVELPEGTGIRGIGAEQSNSSVIIGDQMILKLYRRLADGEHPEVEMGRFLTETAGYANTPKLLGTVTFVGENQVKRALGILQEFVRNQGDGWSHALNYVNRVFDSLRLPGSDDEALAPMERHAIYLEQVKTLARRVAELHRALAIDTDDPVFRPEPINAGDMETLRKDISAKADAAFAVLRKLARSGNGAAGLDEMQLRAFSRRRKECLERIRALTDEPVRAMKTRIHGDLHLGQVLVVKDDFQVIDFEGAPAEAMSERRRKLSPVRDVAGMLRSFEYAAWSALFGLVDRDPEGYARLLPFAMEWRQLVQKTFLEAYQETIAGCPSWPGEERELSRSLQLFLLDKVLYEISYEAASRPAWLRIPIKGLGELLDAPVSPKGVARVAA